MILPREIVGKRQVKLGLGAEGEPEEFGVEEENSDGDNPGNDDGEARVDKFAHAAPVAGELNERNHGKWELEAENDLAEDQ